MVSDKGSKHGPWKKASAASGRRVEDNVDAAQEPKKKLVQSKESGGRSCKRQCRNEACLNREKLVAETGIIFSSTTVVNRPGRAGSAGAPRIHPPVLPGRYVMHA